MSHGPSFVNKLYEGSSVTFLRVLPYGQSSGAFFSGLQVARVSKIIVETDSKVAADMIHKGIDVNPSVQSILSDILKLLRDRTWQTALRQVQRSTNVCANSIPSWWSFLFNNGGVSRAIAKSVAGWRPKGWRLLFFYFYVIFNFPS